MFFGVMNRQYFRNIVESVLREYLEEGSFEDTHDSDEEMYDEYEEEDEVEMSPFEEYENDYPNSRFEPSSIGEDELIDFCKRNDFLFVWNNPLFGRRLSNANSSEVKKSVIDDIMNCSKVVRTHEIDNFLYRYEKFFDNFYIVVMKLCDTSDGDYYVLYMKIK